MPCDRAIVATRRGPAAGGGAGREHGEAARHLPYALNLREESLARVEVSADERARITRANEAFCQMLPAIVVGTALAHRGLNLPEPRA